MHENCSKLCSSILTFVSHYPVLQNVNFFLLEGTFSLEKWKSKWTLWFLCWRWWKAVLFVTFGILLYTRLWCACLIGGKSNQPTNQPMADSKKHVLSKVVKNISFQIKTLLVMFYRHNKIFWYQLCNFKHFLKAENSEDSLASSCEEFCMGFR